MQLLQSSAAPSNIGQDGDTIIQTQNCVSTISPSFSLYIIVVCPAALRSTIRTPPQSCQPSAPKSGWKPNQWQPIRSDGSEIAPRLTSPLLLPLPPLLPLPHCCYCSVTAVCRFSSAVFLGAPPLLNCYCADTSVTMHATNDLSSSLPLISFVTSFAVSTHLHDSSDSSYQRFNLMPCFLLRQVVCQILFARDSSHFYSS